MEREADDVRAADRLVRERAAPVPVPGVPEVVLPTAADVLELWEETERGSDGPRPPPFWGFPWVGGQALARHVLDHPALVAGARVVDVACGSGLVAVAAALAGAARVRAVDVDPLAVAAARWSADLNGVGLEVVRADVLAGDALSRGGVLADARVVLVGDLFYERATAQRLLPLLRRAAGAGALVLVGDPGRAYLPTGLEEVARHEVPVVAHLEDADVRSTAVLRVV
ncbi:50S ribosomal protein L11 methyltransferase [Pseudokineococcus basanitobsidens]|uniref:50S ribosomal protein L11 methyltransferase n=1 Tax=Pseudokineococcus basanitobsidens TaxID=1926649 RepID=A0ABU8RJC6_9ACTN